MKRSLFLIIVVVLFCYSVAADDLEVAGTPQAARKLTGHELLKMFRAPYAAGINGALEFIGEIYGPKLNDARALDRDTLYGLGELVNAYLTGHPERLDRDAAELVLEALKTAPAQIEAQKAFWQKACEAAQAYFSEPSAANAENLYAALPERQLPGLDFKGEVRLVNFIFQSLGPDGLTNLTSLEKRMEEGEERAIDIGFRLINIADGAFAEGLFYGLGMIIPKHPRLFLQKLLAYEVKTGRLPDHALSSILHPVWWWEAPNNDPDNVKYNELSNTRIDMRIKALKTVQDPQLRELRNRCILILEKMRNEIIG